jgi:hypothetical protein
VPREIILGQRITTLQSYINHPAQSGITLSSLAALEQSVDPNANERSIQAFYSAFNTLGTHLFPADHVSLDEILPGDSSAAQLLALTKLEGRFDTYAIDFSLGNTLGQGVQLSGDAAAPSGADCVGTPVAITLPHPITLGFAKDPSVLTYYAVRLTAKARVLFSPFGDLTLKAYAAAQPFGSRIGPPDAQFTTQNVTANSSRTSASTTTLANAIPNLPVLDNDSAGQGRGWDTQQVLGNYFSHLNPGARAAQTISSDALEDAYQIAMAPNPWEGKLYTIMNDAGIDPFLRNFDGSRTASIWAPLFPPGQDVSQSSQFQSLVRKYFATPAQSNQGSSSAIQGTLIKGLTNYINSMRNGHGEDGESIYIARLKNPLLNHDGKPLPASSFTVLDQTQFKTSWNTHRDAALTEQGRVGYSVKFIAFDSLTQHKNPSNGTDSWSNDLPSGDPDNQGDVPFIRH